MRAEVFQAAKWLGHDALGKETPFAASHAKRDRIVDQIAAGDFFILNRQEDASGVLPANVNPSPATHAILMQLKAGYIESTRLLGVSREGMIQF